MGSLNRAIEAIASDWFVVLRPGVVLAPDALSSTARSLALKPEACLVYADDDRIDPETGDRWNPFFKPDWSPDLLLAMDYLSPFVLFQREQALAAGGLREGFPGAESTTSP